MATGEAHRNHLRFYSDRDARSGNTLGTVVVITAPLPNGVAQVTPRALGENLTQVQ